MKLTKKQAAAHAKAKAKWKATKPEAYKASFTRRNVVWRYKGILTEEQVLKLIPMRAKKRCAICRKKSVKALHIDHDHKTMRFRGLLCASCNHMLGNARDSIAILRAAIAYLSL